MTKDKRKQELHTNVNIKTNKVIKSQTPQQIPKPGNGTLVAKTAKHTE